MKLKSKNPEINRHRRISKNKKKIEKKTIELVDNSLESSKKSSDERKKLTFIR